MEKYCFVGSEGVGHYSNSHAVEGIFIRKETYEKHRESIDGIVKGYVFHELDGKHSEVDGSPIFLSFDSLREVSDYIVLHGVANGKDRFLELMENDEARKEVAQDIEEVYKAKSSLQVFRHLLTPEENDRIKKYIELIRDSERVQEDG